MDIDSLAERIAGFGVPGLVLLVATSATGYSGAAAVTAALSALGGPLGMLGGVGTFVLISWISAGLAAHGLKTILKRVVHQLIEDGLTRDEIIETVEGYPISKSLELKLKEEVSDVFGD